MALAVYLTAVILRGFQSGWNVVDDALILCRYAANVASGAGWVFNPGESVESFSSPLWVALLSLGGRLGMDLPYLSRALGVLSGGVLVVAASRALRPLVDRPARIALTVALAGDAGLALWAISGMETAGFALLVLLTALALLAFLSRASPAHAWLVGGLAGILALTRPEGLILGATCVAVALVAPAADEAGPAPPRITRWWAPIPFVAIVGAFLAWRIREYGDWLPLSLRNKLLPRGDGLLWGAWQALLFLLRRLPLVAGAVLGLASAFRSGSGMKGVTRPPGQGAWRAALAILIGLILLGVIVAGGDWMGADRLPAAALPLLALLAAIGLGSARGRRSLPPAALVVAAAATLSLSWWNSDEIPQHGQVAARLGLWLRQKLPADTRIGVAAAGAVPYYSGFHAVDALGITDPVVARRPPPAGAPWKPGHMRYDTERFLSRRPDVIVWEFGAQWCLARMANPPQDAERRRGDYRRELLWSPEFRACYRPMSGLPPEVEHLFTVFRRRDDRGGP